jgi:hypothetical protein
VQEIGNFQVLTAVPGDFGGSVRLTMFLKARAQVSLMGIKDVAAADLDNSSLSASSVIFSISSWSSSCWNRVTGQRLRRSCDRSDLEMHLAFSWIEKLAM